MVDKIQTELNVGLSEEEKDDLEKLIKTFKSEQSLATIRRYIGRYSETGYIHE
jgi:hypothetical protein